MTLRPEILKPRLNEKVKLNIVSDAYATPRHTLFAHGKNENKIEVTELRGNYNRNLRKLALIKTAHSIKHLQETHSTLDPKLFAFADEIRVTAIFKDTFEKDDPFEHYNAKEIISLFGNREQMKISRSPLMIESARVHGTTAKGKLHRQIKDRETKELLTAMHAEIKRELRKLKRINTVNRSEHDLEYHIFITEQIGAIIANYIDPNRGKQNEELRKVRPSQDIESQQWCKLAVALPKLEMNHNGRMNRKNRPHEQGRTPKHLNRLLTDPNRRIFSKKAKSLGGTVIIDCSGSMDLSETQIEQMVKSASGSTIWAYSSSCSNNDIENCWLLAHNGKSVRYLPRFHGGNGVDLPALAHAYRNKRHRSDLMIWISDGRVTGHKDSGSRNLRIATAKFIKKFMIENEPKLDMVRVVIAPSGEKLSVNVGFGVDFFRPFF